MRRALGLVVAGLVALGISACDQPHNALGTGSSVCYPAVAKGHEAVHGHGSLVGVRKANVERLARRVPAAADLGSSTVCLVAYRGNFSPADVDQDITHRTGTYAIVAVDLKDHRVLATIVLDRLPVRFRHL